MEVWRQYVSRWFYENEMHEHGILIKTCTSVAAYLQTQYLW